MAKMKAGSELETMVKNIEDARTAGKREGVEGCLRFLTELRSRCTKDEHRLVLTRAMAALTQEMQRRLWIAEENDDG